MSVQGPSCVVWYVPTSPLRGPTSTPSPSFPWTPVHGNNTKDTLPYALRPIRSIKLIKFGKVLIDQVY